MHRKYGNNFSNEKKPSTVRAAYKYVEGDGEGELKHHFWIQVQIKLRSML